MTSKLGPHVLRSCDGASQMLIAGARIVKFVDDFGLAAQAVSAGALVIGRVYSSFDAQSQRAAGETPQVAADRFVESQLEKYLLNPAIKLWEGQNEYVCSDSIAMTWFSDYEEARVRRMATYGLRSVIGNFSTGNPDLPLWTSFLPAIRMALQHNGLLGLHEYTSPLMWSLTGKYQVDPNADAGDTGWTTLRYRKVIRDYLKPASLEEIPIVITECGLDRIGQVRPGMSSGNWRTNAQWWPSWDGSTDPIDYWRNGGRDAEKYYAEQLKWYDREMQKDPSVVGAVIFTVGSYGLPWSDYDIDGTKVVQYLSEHITAEAGNPNSTIPPPPSTPTPIPPQEISMLPINFADIYEWDAQAGAPEPGNTIQIPKGMDFAYVSDHTVRVTWQDIKQGSPTYGQPRTSDNPFLKPEVMPKTQAQMPDIPFPVGVSALSKCFKGYGPMWVLYIATFDTVAGSKYKVTWPVRPEQVSSYNGSAKVYADDPAAAWLRLRVKAGSAALTIDPTKPLDSSWYNGRDFAYGYWFTPQVVVDATEAKMKVGLEFMCPFGLQDDDLMVAPPILELVSSGGSTEPPPIPVGDLGTVRGLTSAVLASATQAQAGVKAVVDAAIDLNALVG